MNKFKKHICTLMCAVMMMTLFSGFSAVKAESALPGEAFIECSNGMICVGGSFEAESSGSTYRVYLATYDSDNSLIKIDISNANAISAGTNEISFEADFIQNVQNVRAFVWDEDMTPLCKDVQKTVYSLKILAVGNSFSDDALTWLYQIAKAKGIDCVSIANAFIGGCSINTHYNNIQNNNASYTYKYISDDTSGKWQSEASQTLSYCLRKEDWNLITVQQASGSSGIADTYSNLESVNAWIDENKTNPFASLAWHMTWAYQQNSTHSDFAKYNNDQITMYNAIVNATKSEILTKDEFDFIIPAGTTVQNLRTSFIGDNLTRDGYHMSNYLGRYTVGMTWFKAITGLDIDDITYVPSATISEMQQNAVKECVDNAIAVPYEVTPSAYTSVPVYLSESYTELDWEPEAASFYNSTNTDPSAKVKNSSLADKYFSSAIFAREGSENAEGLTVIPDGSIIMIADGYQYRPDAWTQLDTKTTTRPGNVTTSIVITDDAWWGNFNYRAFNVANTANTAINTMTADELSQILKIYIPTGELLPYTEVDLDIKHLSYYNSSTGNVQYTTGTAGKQYASTKLFEKSELPAGTLIVSTPGYKYRPEGWTYLSVNNTSRPKEVTEAIVSVTADWWGTYNYRGFNIAKNPVSDISDMTKSDIESRFRIFVPKA